MPESTELRRQRARHAALTRWAAIPPAERSRRAKAAYRRRFENQVDPNRELSPADRAVLVDAAIRAYVARMGLARLRKREEAQ